MTAEMDAAVRARLLEMAAEQDAALEAFGEFRKASESAFAEDAAAAEKAFRTFMEVSVGAVTGDGFTISDTGVSGSVSGTSVSVRSSFGPDGAFVRNSGELIVGGRDGRALDVTAPVDVEFENVGVVSARGFAYAGGAGADTVRNSGEIIGKISLRGGDDRYDGREGTLVGRVLGGSGEDVLRAGDDGARLDGGAGDDRLVGRFGEDRLQGGSGDDRLFGEGGRDRLSGEAGQNVLTGGSGADRFVFLQVAFEDRVTDFRDGVDLLDLKAFGFGSAAAVRRRASDSDAGLVVDLADRDGGSLLLDDFSRAQLGSDDLIL